MRGILVSDGAARDLADIVDWITAENPRAAIRTLDRIVSAIRGLSDFSTRRPGRLAGTRDRIVVGVPYIITYRTDLSDDGKILTVLTIRHMAREFLG